jgi:hypothetical protein
LSTLVHGDGTTLPTVTLRIAEIRNPKHEIRNNGKKLETGETPPAASVLNFDRWNLFRISSFGFRASESLRIWFR